MNLVIDIGNSRSKIAVIDVKGDIVDDIVISELNSNDVFDFADKYDVEGVIICSVRNIGSHFLDDIEDRYVNILLFTHSTPIPISNNYSTPQTLGLDRLAAAVGAYELYGAREMMIVDFGTAITIDFVVESCFMGGNISPGASLRFKSLHEFTDKLPLCFLTEDITDIGNSTNNAVENGVVLSIMYEIETYINRFKAKYNNLQIIFTGGDGKYFANKLKSAIFVNCELVILGLNEILNYNNAINKKN